MENFQLTKNIIDNIRNYRHEVRSLGTLGGCYQVSLFIEHFYKLPTREGIYQSSKFEPIVSHRWNVLPDGSILESTGDQFCEGCDIDILNTNHKLFSRYRPQWSTSLNPKITPWLSNIQWLEIIDSEWIKQNSDKKVSQGYWLEDNSEYLKWRNKMSEEYSAYKRI
ncbi:MAG: hypothetical protein HOP07_18610 [Bacteriovoracaceae bacterium]|nr:hypothetical protein [Bacteriovoracaceae bacterium]